MPEDRARRRALGDRRDHSQHGLSAPEGACIADDAPSARAGAGTTAARSGDADDSTPKYLTVCRPGAGTSDDSLCITASCENTTCVAPSERG